MYECRQTTLSEQLTALLLAVLSRWSGGSLRLCYVSDGGDAEEDYYRRVLRRLRHPRTKQPLEWLRVADYWHACQYVQKLAEALFPEEKARQAWSGRMRRLLRDDAKGVQRVLRSAAALRHKRGGLTGERAEKYNQGYGYLQKRIPWMCYAQYKRVGMPIGSGVTEAACKTLFSQRLKLSGMQWGKEGAGHRQPSRVGVEPHLGGCFQPLPRPPSPSHRGYSTPSGRADPRHSGVNPWFSSDHTHMICATASQPGSSSRATIT
jgi:hypothetical protein